MTTPATPYDALNSATGTMGDDLLKVGGVGLGIGVTLFVLRKGWSLLRGFVH